MVYTLLMLALGVAAAAVLGPLGLGLIQWRVSANALNQTLGADAAMLVLVAPVALAAAWLWRRGHRLAAPLALGAGPATLYYAAAAVLGADYTRYPGNNERFFLLYLVLVMLSWLITARAWAALDLQPPRPPSWLMRSLGTVLIAGASAIGLAWITQLVELAVTGALSSPADALAYAEAPSAFWLIRLVDLGVIVPICLATGAGLWRDSATALRAAYGVASFMTLQATSVLAMGAVMLWRHDPTASPALVYVLVPITLALAALTMLLLAPYTRASARTGGQALAGAAQATVDA